MIRVLMLCILLFAIERNMATKKHERCNRQAYKKIGCFKEDISNRYFNRLVFNDRGPGTSIDWKNWNEYLHGLVCRCWKAVTQLKRAEHELWGIQHDKYSYTHFTIHFYGECWTSLHPKYDIHTLERAVDRSSCVGADFVPCVDNDDMECAGSDHYNYIYHVEWEMTEEEHQGLENGTCFKQTEIQCFNPATPTITP